MALPYYVEPEYWEEAYAEGDAKLASGSTSAALTAVSNSQKILLVASIVSAQGAGVAAAQRIQNAAGIVAAQISSAAISSVTYVGRASVAANLTTVADIVRIKNASVGENYYVDESYWDDGYATNALCQLSIFAKPSATFINSATINCSAALAITVNRVRSTSALVSINAILASEAYFLWVREPDTPETWTDISEQSGIWTDVSDTPETWMEVA